MGSLRVFSSTHNCIIGNIVTHRLVVQPEGEPGDNHDHEAGDIDGDNVEGELSGKDQVYSETTVFSSCGGHIAVLVGVIGHLESSRQTEIAGKL